MLSAKGDSVGGSAGLHCMLCLLELTQLDLIVVGSPSLIGKTNQSIQVLLVRFFLLLVLPSAHETAFQ